MRSSGRRTAGGGLRQQNGQHGGGLAPGKRTRTQGGRKPGPASPGKRTLTQSLEPKRRRAPRGAGSDTTCERAGVSVSPGAVQRKEADEVADATARAGQPDELWAIPPALEERLRGLLLRSLRADDAAGIQERKRELLEVFRSIADPHREALEQRMALRASDDELVELIYHRLAEPTSRALFETLAGSAVPMPSATDSVTLPAFLGQVETGSLRTAPEEPIEVPADEPQPMLAWAEAEHAPPDESPGVSLAWTLSAPSGEKQSGRGMWLPKTRLGTGFAPSVDEPGEHELALDLLADGQLVGQVARGVSAESARDDDSRGDTDWSAIIGEASSPLGEFGRVDAEAGVRLRPEPHHGADTIEILPFGAYLYAERETDHGWCYVSTSSDPAGAREAAPAGLVGFVERQHIALDLPEPAARLHWVESGEMLKDIAATYYKGEGGFSWGQDARLFVEAIWKANEGRRSGITREEVELSWLDRKVRSEAGEENQRIWQGVQVRADHAIWIPSAAFVKSLKDQGAIDSGSMTHGAWEAAKEVAEEVVDLAKYAAGVPLGVVQGAYESVRDLLVGVVNIAKFVGSFVASLIREGLIDACVELGKNVRDAVKAAPEILKSLGAWFVENWNNPDAFARGRFHGRVIGYVLVEVLLALISAGAITAAKVGARFGTLAANFIRAARAVDSAIDPIANARRLKNAVTISPNIRARMQNGPKGGGPDAPTQDAPSARSTGPGHGSPEGPRARCIEERAFPRTSWRGTKLGRRSLKMRSRVPANPVALRKTFRRTHSLLSNRSAAGRSTFCQNSQKLKSFSDRAQSSKYWNGWRGTGSPSSR